MESSPAGKLRIPVGRPDDHAGGSHLASWEQERLSLAPLPPLVWSATLHAVAGSQAFLTTADEAPRPVIMMAGGDCLGLATHPAVVAEAMRATRRYGSGSGAGGRNDPWHAPHAELERSLAAFVRAESALLFSGRYGALVTTVSALLRPGDLLLVDAPANEAIVEAGYLARARVERFAHGDPDDLLARIRRWAEPGTAILVALEGVSGFDGRLAPLRDIVAIAREYEATVFLDDTHALGVAGPAGHGSAEAAALSDGVDYVAGCLGGFLGSTGAFVAGRVDAIDWLRETARARHDSPPPPAASSVAAIASLGVFETEPELRRRLWQNICFMRDGLRARGFDVGRVESALVPLNVGDEERMIAIKSRLLTRGLYAAHLGSPLVPPAESRLRLTVKCDQGTDELGRALDVLEETGHEFGLTG